MNIRSRLLVGIRQYVTEKENLRNKREAHLLKITTPNEQLKRGLVLVDTGHRGHVCTALTCNLQVYSFR